MVTKNKSCKQKSSKQIRLSLLFIISSAINNNIHMRNQDSPHIAEVTILKELDFSLNNILIGFN